MSKMSKSILFICLSVLFVAGSTLELTQLCSKRLYGADTIVNAFYRLKLSKTLDPIRNYMVDADHPNYDQYEDLLSSIFVYKSSLSEIIDKFDVVVKNESAPSIRSIHGFFQSTRPTRRAWPRSYTFNRAEENLKALKLIFSNLDQGRITKDLIPTVKLAKELNSVGQLEAGQISLFRNKFLNVFYKKSIAKFDKLTVQRNQSLYLDDSTVPVLHFSLYLPFRHGGETVKKNCVYTDSLPMFYTNETKISENENVILRDVEGVQEEFIEEEPRKEELNTKGKDTFSADFRPFY